MNIIKEFDEARPVNVYRNLTQSCFSIKQGKHVVAYADQLILKDAVFHVNQNGVDRIREKRRKEVIGWIRGYVSSRSELSLYHGNNRKDLDDDECLPCCPIRFNPYENRAFCDRNNGKQVFSAKFVDLDISDKTGNMVLAIEPSYDIITSVQNNSPLSTGMQKMCKTIDAMIKDVAGCDNPSTRSILAIAALNEVNCRLREAMGVETTEDILTIDSHGTKIQVKPPEDKDLYWWFREQSNAINAYAMREQIHAQDAKMILEKYAEMQRQQS